MRADQEGAATMSESLYSVISVSFEKGYKAYEAYADLRAAEGTSSFDIVSAVIVERSEDGTLRVPNAQSDRIGRAMRRGSLIGALVGVLGGPLGLLLGLGTGMVMGGIRDRSQAEEALHILEDFADSVHPGATVLLVEVEEPSEALIDERMEALGGTVLRRPAADVLSELEVAARAAESARKEARRARRESRRGQRRQTRDQRLAEVRKRLGLENPGE